MMRKFIYVTICLLVQATIVLAQVPIKKANEAIADLIVFQDELLIYTKKDNDGQYIYTAQRNKNSEARKDRILNEGIVNALIGKDASDKRLYVYQMLSRKHERIVVYEWSKGQFKKIEERKLPKIRNNSSNLGLFLTEDRKTLYISAELGKSKGYDDLYLSRWKNNRWTKPQNLGKLVNTREAEFSPFVTNDSLFFSRTEENGAYIYAVGLNESAMPSGDPGKLSNAINQENGFNAYYKKFGDRETWISSGETESSSLPYTAFVEEQPKVKEESVTGVKKPEEESFEVVKGPVGEEEESVSIIKQEEKGKPELAQMVAASSLTLYYDFNKVFLSEKELTVLVQHLTKLQEGAKIAIKGYSDIIGSERGREQVSWKRALYVKWYIDKYLAHKQFSTSIENEVIAGKGKSYRKAEIFEIE